MKKFLILLISLWLSFLSHAQIIEQETTPTLLPTLIPAFNEVTAINSSTVNINFSTPTQDPTPIDGDSTTEGNGALQYANIAAVNIAFSSGNFTSTSLGKVWTLKIIVPNAKNIGLVLSQVTLAPNAEMYVYNQSKTRLKGVIKAEHFSSLSRLSIAPTKDAEIYIYILERNNFSVFQSNFTITKVLGGFIDFGEDAAGTALLMNAPPEINSFARLNVNQAHGGPNNLNIENNELFNSKTIHSTTDYSGHCSPYFFCYPNKATTARAVAIFSAGGWGGTGTLINNESSNGRAYFITAFHILDHFPKNDQIDAVEIDNLVDANFTFQFWRPGCGGAVNRGINFSGATLIAANRGTDMVLLELTRPPGVGDGVNYAGWNRTTNASSNTLSSIIHHPQGLDMRYTQTRFVRSYLFNSNYWQAGYQNGYGTMARGSSGAALLNENNQVVGQLKAGWSSCFFSNFSDRFGKFDRSYSAANLQQFLSPVQNLTEVGQLTLNPLSITGVSEIGCTTSQYTYSVPNLTGVSYFWLITSDFTIVSGQNTSAITIKRNSSLYASASITVNLTDNKGRTRFLSASKVISGGASIEGTISQTGQPNKPMYTVNSIYAGTANVSLYLQGATNISCTRTSGSGTWSYIGQYLTINLSSGSADFQMSGTGSCGFTSRTVTFYVSGGWRFSVAPNPASNDLYITATGIEDIEAPDIVKQKDLVFTASLYDFNTRLLIKQIRSLKGDKQVKINVRGLKKGKYVLEITYDKYRDSRHIIIE